MNAVMKNICKEVQSILTLRSSLLFKKKVTLNLTVSLFKKYSYTNSSQKALLIVLLENNIYITVNFPELMKENVSSAEMNIFS